MTRTSNVAARATGLYWLCCDALSTSRLPQSMSRLLVGPYSSIQAPLKCSQPVSCIRRVEDHLLSAAYPADLTCRAQSTAFSCARECGGRSHVTENGAYRRIHVLSQIVIAIRQSSGRVVTPIVDGKVEMMRLAMQDFDHNHQRAS